MDVEKIAGDVALSHDEETTHGRTIVFPHGIHEHEKQPGHARPKGVEMKRSITQEERELAAAGYEHLQQSKAPNEAAEGDEKDIHEHKLPIEALLTEMQTSFDVKDPARSQGLTTGEAQARIQRDGPNVLTPPKKKSGLRKVRLFATRHSGEQ